MMRSMWTRLWVAGLIGAMGAACSRGGGGEAADQVALFTKNQTNPYFQSIRLGAESAASQMKAGIVHYVPTKPDSIPEQMSQIEDAIIKQPDVIVFIPVDFKAMVPSVQKLNAASIPVVNLTDRSAGGQFVSFVGCDDERLGLSAGRYLLKHLDGKGNVIIIEGVGGSANSAARVRGFNQAISEFPGVKLVASQPGNFQRLQALQVTENLLQAHSQIDGVLAANDAMALGAIEALDGANRKAAVIGINGTKEAVDAIKAGKLLATVDCNGFEQGCIGVMTAIRHLRQLPVPKEFAFPQPVIDRSNYGDLDMPDAQRSCPMWEELVRE
jgi:ribose transport system substrate-binding protein